MANKHKKPTPLATKEEIEKLLKWSEGINKAVSLVADNRGNNPCYTIWEGAVVHFPGRYLILATAKNGKLI